MKILIQWILSAIVIMVVAYVLPGVDVSGFLFALVVALVLGLVNAFIRPVVLFLTLPINILTLGLFTLIVNTLMVLLVDSIVAGFSVSGFGWVFVFSIALWIVNSLLSVSEPKKTV